MQNCGIASRPRKREVQKKEKLTAHWLSVSNVGLVQQLLYCVSSSVSFHARMCRCVRWLQHKSEVSFQCTYGGQTTQEQRTVMLRQQSTATRGYFFRWLSASLFVAAAESCLLLVVVSRFADSTSSVTGRLDMISIKPLL